MRRAVSFLVALFSLQLGALPALGNGRPPAAGQVVFHPDTDLQLLVRNTFGLAFSKDGGRSWSWICEQAIGFSGIYDPPVVIDEQGGLHVATYLGLAYSSDGCGWS